MVENLYKVLISLLVGFCLLGLTDGPSTNSQSFLIGVLSQLLVKSMRKNQRKNAPPHGRVFILNEIENESTTVILTLIQQIGKYGNKTNISDKCSSSSYRGHKASLCWGPLVGEWCYLRAPDNRSGSRAACGCGTGRNEPFLRRCYRRPPRA